MTSGEAAFQEGTFAQNGRFVFWTEDRTAGDRLGAIFILEEGLADDAARIPTAPSGRIGQGVLEDETCITLTRNTNLDDPSSLNTSFWESRFSPPVLPSMRQYS